MSNIEGLVVLTGEEGFHQTSQLSKDDDIKRLIIEEGDKDSFVINNLQCNIKRNHGGVWCGYVGVNHDHPWYGKGYQELVTITDISDSINNRNPNNVNILSVLIDMMEDNLDEDICSISTAIDVHGGITYSDKGEDGLWYFGFDCGHSENYMPNYPAQFRMEDSIYRTKEFVINECHRLVDQLLTVPYDSGV